MSVATVWEETLDYIEGKVPKQVYDTWFVPIHLDRIENSTAYVGVPNKFFGDWLQAHYGPLLIEALSIAYGVGSLDIAFPVLPNPTPLHDEMPAPVPSVRPQGQAKTRRGIQLNPKYIFKNF